MFHNARWSKILVVFVVTVLVLAAQSGGTGAITGTVTDPAGSVVPQADIKVTNLDTSEVRTAASTSTGSYLVSLLPPGTYRVDVSKTGFKLLSHPHVRVNVTETQTLNARLEVGAVSDQVTVAADAEVLQTESSALGHVTSEEMVQNLPLVTRNFTQIIGLNAGVSTDVTNATDLGRGNGGLRSFSSQGGHVSDNNFQMDGVGANDLQNSGAFSAGVAIPNPDTIQEFKVQTGQYDATYGRNAGANVNVITKGGSNAFHGTLFEFFRNEKLNANDFFFNQAGQQRPKLRQNQFGGTAGGPVIKDKLLFFGSYQGTRQLNGVSNTCSVSYRMPPLTDDRSRGALGRLFAGQRGLQQIARGNVGPAILPDGSNISAPAFALLNMKFADGSYVIPSPQRIDSSQPFASQGFSAYSKACTFTEDQYMGNADYLQSSKSKFAFRFFSADSDQAITFQSTNLGGPTAPGWPVLNPNKFRNASVTHTYIFTPTLLNEFEIGYHRVWSFTDQTEPIKFSDFGVNAPPSDNGIPEIAITGALTLGGNGQSLNIAQNTFVIQDALTYTWGRHSLRFGGGITRTQDNAVGFHYIGGLTFQSFPDFLLGLNATQNGTAAAGVASSNVFSSVDLQGLFDRAWRTWDGNIYVQDDIKVSRRLTVNIGFRYERLGDLGDELGRNSNFDYRKANQNPPATGSLQGYVVPSNYSGPLPDGVTKLDNNLGISGTGQNTWNPRVGFAWQLPHTDRVVLRGGYGIYHQRTTGQPFFQLLTAPPWSLITSLSGTSNAAATFDNPFLAGTVAIPSFPKYSPTTNLGLTIIDPNYRAPTLHRYSMGLQTKLARDLVLEVGYTGSRGLHLIRSRSINQANLASVANPIRGVTTNSADAANKSARSPYPGFTIPGLTDLESAGASWYNALDVSLEKRFSHGLQFMAAYTYARLLSTDSGSSSGANGGSATGDQNNPLQRYGPDAFVRDQRFVLSSIYSLPGFKNRKSLLGETLGGWQVGGVFVIQTGQRLSLTATNAANVFGITSDRAQMAAGCTYPQLVTTGSIQQRLGNYFNKACLTTSPVIGDDKIATAFGNTGIGIVRGPGQANVDFSVIKQFGVPAWTDRAHLEFRTELFNAFNHPQFGNPTTSFTSASFGRILATSVNPRVIQFALKFSF